MDSICHDIEQVALPPLATPEQRSKSWIFVTSWRIVDRKNALYKFPGLTNSTEYCRLTRSLKSPLKEDQKQQSATTNTLAEVELNQGRIREAWSIICH